MYNHKDLEDEIAKFWIEKGIYNKVKLNRKDGKPLYFVDGPPYATGQIHPGTVWNKTIKDAMIRYYRGLGYNVRDQPGFDTHGLPIEVKVEKLLKIKDKKEIETTVGVGKFNEECKKFANKFINIMKKQFNLFGIWMDWDNPYVTYKDEFIEKAWGTIKKAQKKGLLKEGFYVLPYCPRCRTTLANYELEYKEKEDPSIYVKFKLKNSDAYLLIWTTTPWTLVSNLAVMVHPDYDYAYVKTNKGILIIAKDRLEALKKVLDYEIIKVVKGKELKGLEYEHPFQDLIKKEYNRKVILNDKYVTLEEGTGLVHVAPGHGPEDFEVGKENNIEIFSPVDEKGNYTEEAGKFKGMYLYEANDKIINILKERESLVYQTKIKHRYPHCWRCKTPLIYKTSKQWFINIKKIKKKMLVEIKKSHWIPKFAEERFRLFVDSARDWCISRQRYWGIPLPIWRDKNGHIMVISSKKELNKNIKELHRPYIDEVEIECPICHEKMKRVPDVLDVWFDSGNVIWASLTEEDKKEYGEVGDLIIEGHDQIRGWFYSLLGSGLIYYDKIPYKTVMMHGFFLDEKGEKMSKSVGNFIPVEEIKERYGADAFRLFGLSNTIWEDLKFSWDELKEAKNDLNILFNLIIFLKRNVKELPSKNNGLKIEDRWILSKMNSLIQQYHNAFASYMPNIAAKMLREFLVKEFSQFYMKIAKKRLTENDKTVKYIIFNVVLDLLKLFAPFAPYITEYLYQDYYKQFFKEESIHIFYLPKHDISKINIELEKNMELTKHIISKILMVRNEKGIKIRQPLNKAIIKLNNNADLTNFVDIIKQLTNIKDIEFNENEGEIFELGKIWVDTNLNEELINEGISNEILRRIQFIRKKLNLVESDPINVYIEKQEEVEKALNVYKEKIKERANIKDLVILKSLKDGQEFKVNNIKIKLRVEKI